MQAGTPIIASDIPVHREVLDDAGLFVNPFSIDSIGLAMHRLVHDKSLQKDLAAKSDLRLTDFNWEKTAKETLYVYSLFT